MHAHGARGIRHAHRSICARPRHQNPETLNPPKAAGLHTGEAGIAKLSTITSFPYRAKNRKRLLAMGKVCLVHAASGGLFPQPPLRRLQRHARHRLRAALPSRQRSASASSHRGMTPNLATVPVSTQ